MGPIAAFALGTLFGMFALLVGMVANAAARRNHETTTREALDLRRRPATERLDRDALEVDRLAMDRRKTRTMWGE